MKCRGNDWLGAWRFVAVPRCRGWLKQAHSMQLETKSKTTAFVCGFEARWDWIQAFFPGSVLVGTRQAGKQAAMAGLGVSSLRQGALGALNLCCPAPDTVQGPTNNQLQPGSTRAKHAGFQNRSDVPPRRPQPACTMALTARAMQAEHRGTVQTSETLF